MTRKKNQRMFLLIREDWNGKIIHVPWMYAYTLKGYNIALNQKETLRKLFPNKVYNLKCFEFTYGLETEIQFNFEDLK